MSPLKSSIWLLLLDAQRPDALHYQIDAHYLNIAKRSSKSVDPRYEESQYYVTLALPINAT